MARVGMLRPDRYTFSLGSFTISSTFLPSEGSAPMAPRPATSSAVLTCSSAPPHGPAGALLAVALRVPAAGWPGARRQPPLVPE